MTHLLTRTEERRLHDAAAALGRAAQADADRVVALSRRSPVASVAIFGNYRVKWRLVGAAVGDGTRPEHHDVDDVEVFHLRTGRTSAHVEQGWGRSAGLVHTNVDLDLVDVPPAQTRRMLAQRETHRLVGVDAVIQVVAADAQLGRDERDFLRDFVPRAAPRQAYLLITDLSHVPPEERDLVTARLTATATELGLQPVFVPADRDVSAVFKDIDAAFDVRVHDALRVLWVTHVLKTRGVGRACTE